MTVLKRCVIILLCLGRSFEITMVNRGQECTTAPHPDKCTDKDPRYVYHECMLGDEGTDDSVLWCDQSNYRSIPDPATIKYYKKCNETKTLYINDSCLGSVTKDDLGRFPCLRTFVCDANQISELEEETFLKNSNLTSISFCTNRISTIHRDAFKGLANLEVLNLDNNRIGYIAYETFRDLKSLRELSLHNNRLQTINNGVFDQLVGLQVMRLTGNRIRSISPGSFKKLGQLTHLHLDGNDITSIDATAISGLGRLQVLSISYNNLKAWPESKDMDFQDSLHTLDLGHNMLENFGSTQIANMSKLQNLSLVNNSLTNLPENLFATTQTVKYFNAAINNLHELPANMFSGLCHLNTLILTKNKLKTPKMEWFMIMAKSDVTTTTEMAHNPWRCDCEIVRFLQFMENLEPSKFRQDLTQMKCDSPKKFKRRKVHEEVTKKKILNGDDSCKTNSTEDMAITVCDDVKTIEVPEDKPYQTYFVPLPTTTQQVITEMTTDLTKAVKDANTFPLDAFIIFCLLGITVMIIISLLIVARMMQYQTKKSRDNFREGDSEKGYPVSGTKFRDPIAPIHPSESGEVTSDLGYWYPQSITVQTARDRGQWGDGPQRDNRTDSSDVNGEEEEEDEKYAEMKNETESDDCHVYTTMLPQQQKMEDYAMADPVDASVKSIHSVNSITSSQEDVGKPGSRRQEPDGHSLASNRSIPTVPKKVESLDT